MTRRDKEALKQRLPISLGLMLLGLLMIFFIQGRVHADTPWLLKAVYLLSSAGSLLCGLLFLFYRQHAFWMAYGGLFLLAVGIGIPNRVLAGVYFLFILALFVLFDLWDKGVFKKEVPPIPPLPANTIFVRISESGVCCRLFTQEGKLIAQQLSADLAPLEKQIVFPKNATIRFSEHYNEWLDEVEQLVIMRSEEQTYTLQAEPPTSYDALKAFLEPYLEEL